MEKQYVTLLMLSYIFMNIGAVIREDPDVTIEPEKAYFVNEGERATVKCTVKDVTNTRALDVSFSDNQDEPYVNDTGLVVLIKKNQSTYTTVASLTWDSIQLSNITEDKHHSNCKVRNPNYIVRFTIVVVPKKSVPTIEIVPKETLSVKKHSEVTLTCTASTILTERVKSVKIKWSFQNFSDGLPALPENAEVTDTVTNNNSYANSQLVLSKVTSENIGKYYCSAILYFYKPDNEFTHANTYFKSLEIDKVIFGEKAENTEEEVESKKGDKYAKFDCNVLGNPSPIISWKKDGEPIGAKSNDRYILSSQSTDDPANRYLTITDISFVDRGVYKCFAKRTDTTITKEFTLRVRDPLGALWPFIGIVVEAIVLFIIIGSCELYKRNKKSGKSGRDTNGVINHADTRETSPLVESAPQVSYSGEDNSVRLRTANNDA